MYIKKLDHKGIHKHGQKELNDTYLFFLKRRKIVLADCIANVILVEC